jgi:putative ABC transport system permease protein
MLSKVRSLWRALRHRSTFERDMDDELRFHIDTRIEDLVRSGVTRDEAARRARLEFGNPEAWQDRCRESRGLGVIDALRTDLRFAWRSIRKNILLSATVIATLALGIGANTAMFSVLYSVLAPVPYPQANRLVFLNCRMTLPDSSARTMGWSYPKFEDLQRQTTAFESVAAFAGLDLNLTGPGEPERVRGEIVSADYFSTLGVRARLGALLLPDGPSAPASAILSESMWRGRFGGDPSIIGTTIELNRAPFTVVGVAPASFTGETGRAELWVSVAMTPTVLSNPTRLQQRMAHWLVAVARLRPGVTLARGDEDLKLAFRRMEEAQPSGSPQPGGAIAWDRTVVPLPEAKVDPTIRESLGVLLVAVACVLLITCLNLASVLLGRGVARGREVAIRLALGASRATVTQQFLTESLLLAVIGGVLGFGVAAAGLRLLTELGFEVPAMPGAPFVRSVDLASVRIDEPTVVAYSLLIAVVAGLLFGIVPALKASKLDITEALKGSRASWLAGRRGAGAPALRRGLLITQIALALVLLAGAGLLIRTFDRLVDTRIGIDSKDVLTFRLDLPARQYAPELAARFLEELTSSLRTLPGVHAVSVANALPLQGQTEMTSAAIDRMPQTEEAGVHMVGAPYFEALRIPLIRGRLLNDTDRASSRRVALLSETAERRYTPQGDPIGRRLSLGLNGWNGPGEAEIVGIVGDVKYQLLTMPFRTDIYLSYVQRPPLRAFFVLRTSVAPDSLVPAIRSRVAQLDRGLPIYAIRSMDDVVAAASAGTRFSSLLLGLFSVMALLLACVGVYGTLAYAVAARTREIGIRIALGARPSGVARLVWREVLIIGGVGLGAGLLGARAAGRLLAGLLYQVEPTDPPTLATVSLVLMAAACLAGFLPARRASRIDPLVALREE